MTTEKQQRQSARKAALSAARDLRTVLEDARRALGEFERYVDSWDEELADKEADPRRFTDHYVVDRALGMLGEVEHMPTGGTRHMHWRQARTRLVQLAQALTLHPDEVR